MNDLKKEILALLRDNPLIAAIRDENGFRAALESDIPVIFLTGRSDFNSVINVMPLNPAGYLLKQLKPMDIKREINAFFENLKA